MGKSRGTSKSAQRAAAAAAAEQARLGHRLADMGEADQQVAMRLIRESEPLRQGLSQTLSDLMGVYDPRMPTTQTTQNTFYNPITGMNIPSGGTTTTETQALVAPRVAADQRGILFEPVPVPELPEAYDLSQFDVDPVTIAQLAQDPRYAANKAAMENQYDLAQQNILETVPGQRYSGLLADVQADTARQRAQSMSGLFGSLGTEERARREAERALNINIAEQRRAEELARQQMGYATEVGRREGLLNLAAQLGTQGAATGTGGLGTAGAVMGQGAGAFQGAAGVQNQIAQNQMEYDAAKKGGTGELVGTLGYAAKMSCHTARLVFGETNLNWLLFFEWKEHKAPKWFKHFYNRYTERFAHWLVDKPKLQTIVRQWMEGRINGV